MTILIIFIGFLIALQLTNNQLECAAQSNVPVSPPTVQKRSGGDSARPVGGISVEHPLQATIYAYRRGKMKLLVPFEINVVPLGGIDPERQAPGYAISGPITNSNQPGNSFYPSYNPYGQPPTSYQGSSYYYRGSYPPQQHQTYGTYSPSYNPYNTYYTQQTVRPSSPYYVQPSQQRPVIGPAIRPFPQYQPPPYRPQNPSSYQNPSYQQPPNAINGQPNWARNNTAINISSLLNNTTHTQNLTTPNLKTSNITTPNITSHNFTSPNTTAQIQPNATSPAPVRLDKSKTGPSAIPEVPGTVKEVGRHSGYMQPSKYNPNSGPSAKQNLTSPKSPTQSNDMKGKQKPNPNSTPTPNPKAKHY